MTSQQSDTVLMIEDDPSVVKVLLHVLRNDGLRAFSVPGGAEALAWLAQHRAGLLVLDLGLPDVEGMDFLRHFRADPLSAETPVVILTASNDQADRMSGLELGADDFILKPFSPREVLLRIRAVLRRTSRAGAQLPDRVQRVGDLLIDVDRHVIRVGGKHIHLTATEFRLLQRMASEVGRVLDRTTLGAAIDQNYGSLDRTIDVHIKAIRRKLGPAGAVLVETVRGFGYVLREDARAAQQGVARGTPSTSATPATSGAPAPKGPRYNPDRTQDCTEDTNELGGLRHAS